MTCAWPCCCAGGLGIAGPTGDIGASVNDDECEGFEFLSADIARVNSEDDSACGMCVDEWGANINWVTFDAGCGGRVGWDALGAGVEEISTS